MSEYLHVARRYSLVIGIVLLITWGAGAAMAYIEYTTSFEADATVWTDRQSQQFGSLSPQDPGLSAFVTPAQQQAGLLSQLLQTRNFIRMVVQRASVSRPVGGDERAFLQDIGKRFRVEVLGTNLFRLWYRGAEPMTPSKMVLAALAVRQERLAETRTAATAAATTFYRSELGIAQSRVQDAERELTAFDGTHGPPLSPADAYRESQLRLAVAEAKGRAADLKTRIDGSAVLPDVLQVADSLDFQVLDNPLEEVGPSGGARPAALIAGSAGVAGLALVGLLIIGGTLLEGGRTRRARAARLQSLTVPPPTPNSQLLNPVVLSSAERPRVATTSNPPAG